MVVGSSPAVEVGGERGRRHPPGPDSSDQHGAPQKLTLAPTRKIRGGSTAMGTPRFLVAQPSSTGLYKCGDCRQQFTVTVGTVMHRSKIGLHKWVLAFHLMCSSKKGISALQLQRKPWPRLLQDGLAHGTSYPAGNARAASGSNAHRHGRDGRDLRGRQEPPGSSRPGIGAQDTGAGDGGAWRSCLCRVLYSASVPASSRARFGKL